MRFLLLFFGFWPVNLVSATTGPVAYGQACVRLVGVVQDFSTHRPLAATFSVRSASGRAVLGNSADGTGQFAIDIACTATALLIERTGYRAQRLPLNLATVAPIGEVYVVIPLVATDQQATDRPYLQTEQKHYVQPTGNRVAGQVQHNTFAVSDAMAGLPLRAKVCFYFTKSGQKTCLDTDAQGNCTTDFTEKDIVAMEVQAPGYQPYQGNIRVEQLGGPTLHHTVRLLRELVLLSVQSTPVSTSPLRGVLRREGSKTPLLMASVANKPGVFTSSELLPNRYELLLMNQQQTVLHRQLITVEPGLNVQTITLPDPKAALPMARANVPDRIAPPASVTLTPDRTSPLPDDNLPALLFAEGSYTLTEAACATLQQVGTYLQQHPEIHLRLVGHTDRLGDERLNKSLGENRAKVAASHLHWRWGIADERLHIQGFGSRFLIGSGSDAESHSRNRRVSLKFIPARPETASTN
ncbi:OmpA family protein [Fibrella aquatica]|uniref:OmpA family protein n=1 Tax=Fibrella aquatica TaxID=3242487 RepID=UPI003520D032